MEYSPSSLLTSTLVTLEDCRHRVATLRRDIVVYNLQFASHRSLLRFLGGSANTADGDTPKSSLNEARFKFA